MPRKERDLFQEDPEYPVFVEKEGVVPLAPHESEPVIELFDNETPTILLSLEAHRDIRYLSEAAGSDEIGWLGSVRELSDRHYRIERLFVFEQEVSGGHCEFYAEDVGRFWQEQLVQDPANAALLNSILFWGHLHPGDMIEPSSQDDEQMEVFNENDWFIRGIFTRGGRCQFTFFDYKRGLKVIGCPWRLDIGDDDARRTELFDEVKRKVRGSSVRRGKRR